MPVSTYYFKYLSWCSQNSFSKVTLIDYPIKLISSIPKQFSILELTYYIIPNYYVDISMIK